MNDVYVIGGDGQLGKCLRALNTSYTFLTRQDLDLSKPCAVTEYFKNKNAACILNLAAYTNVDKAESEKELAMQINGHAVGEMAKAAKYFIHVSTDYVFPGDSTKPYKESDPTGPIGAYGESKLLGEQKSQKENDNTIIVRTSWLYSEFGHNFLKTMLRLGSDRKELNVVSDQIGTPTYAGDLAKVLKQIADNPQAIKPGIYHYSNEGQCSWCDFATEIFKIQNMPVKVNPIPTSGYPTPAKRPAYSVLDKNKIKQVLNLEIPNWKTSLVKCLEVLRTKRL
jgi:dTDP-4-dehydrorhamnose reductase